MAGCQPLRCPSTDRGPLPTDCQLPSYNGPMAKKQVVRRRKKLQPGSVGLRAAEMKAAPSAGTQALIAQVEKDGGALLLPDPQVAFKILALNTEKAHNLREKSLDTIHMAPELASAGDGKESDYGFEFEQAPYLTLGAAYEQRPRLSGGAYHPLLRRIDGFLERPVAEALEERESRAAKLLEIDDRVATIVDRLKARGLTSPYLKPFIVARLNPIRFSKSTSFDFDEVLEKMLAAASKFNVEKIKPEDVARTGGAPDET